MLETRFNRYDSKYCIEQFRQNRINIIDNQAVVAFELDNQDFEIYLPLVSGAADPQLIEIAKDVMSNITEMDNLVQQSNADECERTGLAAANYDLYLAYITIEEAEIKLCYYGQRVNTEWDAIFKKNGSSWEKVNF